MNSKQMITVVSLLAAAQLTIGAPTQLVDEKPVRISEIEKGVYLVDFGRVAFGNVRLLASKDSEVKVHFGEDLADGRVNRKPPGTVRYKTASVSLERWETTVVAPSADKRNTNFTRKPPAIPTPAEWGVVLPFRWVEIEGWNGTLKADQIVRQSAFAATWNDDAASFECSDEMLNQIWELCRYSIKATTYAGVYVDGDRERIPYEADAYLNQLSHYYTDNDAQMARDTIDHLMVHGTWPSEWAPHMVFMVHADWMKTGDKQWMAGRYEALKTKTLAKRKGADGLIGSKGRQISRDDIVDWPKEERDGYVFTSRNTVVNAFYLQAIKQMAEMARALGKEGEAAEFEANYRETYSIFQQVFFDAETGLYKDGIEIDHSSLHANLFPLAFGLVPEEARETIAEWLAKRGMQCSVYAAQYLMEGLFEQGAGEQAVALMTAKNDRSWSHMVDRGATITWEAWDQKYKPNQDWNHAWGAAPANLIPRYLLGAAPLTPGWTTALIRPHIAGLTSARGTVPTPRGPIEINWNHSDSFTLMLTLPKGMKARVELPILGKGSTVLCNGKPVRATQSGGRWMLTIENLETVKIEVKRKCYE